VPASLAPVAVSASGQPALTVRGTPLGSCAFAAQIVTGFIASVSFPSNGSG
jgi:hypothetical protein